MTDFEPLRAIGLMSGTSLDGIDVAEIVTDGVRALEIGPFRTYGYEADLRDAMRGVLGSRRRDGRTAAVERRLTLRHGEAMRRFLSDTGPDRRPADLIGFHGQTIHHDPAAGVTLQLGDGALLALETAIPVVSDFRSRDVAHGGEGAPLAPLWHGALATDMPRPIAVLNLGGVGNVTWLGVDNQILAFDTGPANALLDDWVRAATGRPYDAGGALARRGRVNADCLRRLMNDPYFERPPPKSLDRDHFAARVNEVLGPPPRGDIGDGADGAATLTAFTAASVRRALDHLPAAPIRWLASGGGRHNPAMMAALSEAIRAPVAAVEAVGWQGDAIEAQAFAYLAVRSLRGLPLSLPSTTGVDAPCSGGVVHRPG